MDSVDQWLRSLRFSAEYYEYERHNFCVNDAKRTMEILNDNSNEEYVNIWECSGNSDGSFEDESREISTDLDDNPSERILQLSFAEICRYSALFTDEVEEFVPEEIVPVLVESCQFKESEDVMLWKAELRYSCSDDEEDIFECQELLKTFNQIPKEKFEPSPNKFPVSESNDGVEIRRNQSIRRYRHNSKTTDFDLPRKNNLFGKTVERDFEIRGLSKIVLPNSRTEPIDSREIVRYRNGNFWKINEVTKEEKILLNLGVVLKSAKLVNKKEIELRDSRDYRYVLFFGSSRDAKTFIEDENIQRYCVSSDSRTTVKKTLLRFLGKRSSREILEKKGIYKNEPIFGNTLKDIYSKGGKRVPDFVYRTIDLIEREGNVNSLGLYRTSGNLATIQKIRFEVDNGRLEILDEYRNDVDVLTGSLKLFFRELKEPLIPCEVCDKLLTSMKTDQKVFSKKDRDKLRSILNKNLHEANLETLLVLLKHLLKVVQFKNENKMDVYNLAVCWGPSTIFSTSQEPESCRDIVTQSQDATRLIEFLLNFYKQYPDELQTPEKGIIFLEDNPNLNLMRQESRESIGSFSSGRTDNTSASLSSLCVDEIVRKVVELIESNITKEGLYQKPGSPDKSKILKKMNRKKVHELDRSKTDVHDLTDALKKYIIESQDKFVTKEVVDQIVEICDISHNCPLEPVTRRKIISLVEKTPNKDTFVFLLKHITKVMEHENYHRVTKGVMLDIWTNVLNNKEKVHQSKEKFADFLNIVLDAFNDNLPDVATPKQGMVSVIEDLRNQQLERDRYSRYDNVPERGEALILDERTVRTKL